MLYFIFNRKVSFQNLRKIIKKLFLFTIIFTISISLISCSSNQSEKSEINLSTLKLSKDSESILKSLQPDKRIDCIMEIWSVLDRLSKDNDKKLLKDIEYLIQLSSTYNVESMLKFKSRYNDYKDGRLKLRNIMSTDPINIQQYKDQYWYSMILPIYTEKNRYEYPLKVNKDNLIEIAESEGYTHKIEGTSNQDKFTWRYKEITTTDNNTEKGKGDSFTVLTDFHENIIQVFIPPFKKLNVQPNELSEYMKKLSDEKSKVTLNNMVAFLQLSNIENNKYMQQICTKEELGKLTNFFHTLDLNKLKNNIKLLDNGFASLLLTVGDKELLIVGYINSVDISVANKNMQTSKYTKNIKTLFEEFMPEENKTKTSIQNALNIDNYKSNILSSSANNQAKSESLDQKHLILKGNINNNMNIHMNLILNKQEITGYYYYDNNKSNLELKGTYDDNNNIIVDEFSDNKNT